DAYVNPVILEHDHDDLDAHSISSNVDLIGRDLMGEHGPPGSPGEIEVVGDYAYVALLGFGFAIVDVSDPTAPKTISLTEITIPQTPVFGVYTADLKVDVTGNWIFVGMEVSTTPGVLIYDATNKAAPELHGYWAAPGKLLGCHMVEYAMIEEQEYLYCAPLDAAIYVGLFLPPNPSGQRQVVTVGRWAPASQDLAEWMAEDPAQRAPAADSGHDDMTFQIDPITNDPMLFVSFWGLGVWFLDISIPAVPVTLGAWLGEGAEHYRGNIHTTMMFQDDFGRRIVVSIPEVANPPAVFILDATDFTNPKVLFEWMAVPDFGAQAGKFSTHNFQIVDQKLYLTHYHGGIIVIDLAMPEAPVPLGSYMPHEPSADEEPYEVGVWDVVVSRGYMMTADSNGGFYVLHFRADPMGDEDYSSFA
ncbi:MAG TPA: hypothetical protein VGB18_07970, partial [Candidatus Thermoplasmatota archaeon]